MKLWPTTWRSQTASKQSTSAALVLRPNSSCKLDPTPLQSSSRQPVWPMRRALIVVSRSSYKVSYYLSKFLTKLKELSQYISSLFSFPGARDLDTIHTRPNNHPSDTTDPNRLRKRRVRIEFVRGRLAHPAMSQQLHHNRSRRVFGLLAHSVLVRSGRLSWAH